jgi:hypothetical protein
MRAHAGDFDGSRRAAGGGATARHNWWALACGSLLLSCVLLPMTGQTAWADNAAPIVTGVADSEKKPDERDVAPSPETQKPEPETETVVRQPDAPKPDIDVPAPEAQKPEPKTAARQPEAPTSSGKSTDFVAPQLVLSADVAKKVGQRIWFNETAGHRDAITAWNANEEFASLGVGHFIWYPAGKAAPFEESFPRLLEFLRKENTHLPSWVDRTPIPPNPWTSRTDFKRNFNSPEMRELRQFLLETVTGQTQFLVARAQGAMGKILEDTQDKAEREHIIAQFSRITHASKDLYPLIDYINFKGEGTNPAETTVDPETGKRQGWGLKQVLLKMNGSTSDPQAALAEFTDAAQFVLQQRVRNHSANRIWEAGWLRRVESYRRPITDMESNPKPARHASVAADEPAGVVPGGYRHQRSPAVQERPGAMSNAVSVQRRAPRLISPCSRTRPCPGQASNPL